MTGLTKVQDKLAEFKQAGTGAIKRDIQDKLRESVSVKDFGAVGDGVTDDTAAIHNAMNSGAKRVYAPAGIYRHTKLTMPNDVQLFGDGTDATKFLVFGITGDVHLQMGANCTLRDVYFSPEVKASLYDNMPLVTTKPIRDGAFNFNPNINAVGMGDDCLIENCEFDGFYYGIYGITKSNLLVRNSISRGGLWGMFFYICDTVDVEGCSVSGGNDGGLAFVSSRRCRARGNYVSNPNGTGINPGGSSGGVAPGNPVFDQFNASEITIVNNIVYARDCINSENGIDGFVVTGNTCRIATVSSSNGVGVSAQNRDNTGGRIRNVAITGNDINVYDYASTFSTGILVSAAGATSSDVPIEGVTITGNSVTNPTQGIRLECQNANFVQGATVTGNNITVSTTGIYLDRVGRAAVSGNTIRRNSDTTVGSTYGLVLGTINHCSIIGNSVKGLYIHIFQSSSASECYIYDLISQPNDDLAGYLRFQNSGIDPNISFAYSAAAPKAYIVFDGTTGTASSSFFASVTRNGTGDYTVTWTNPFLNANYVVHVTSGNITAASGPLGIRRILSKTTTEFRFQLTTSNATVSDDEVVMVTALGA